MAVEEGSCRSRHYDLAIQRREECLEIERPKRSKSVFPLERKISQKGTAKNLQGGRAQPSPSALLCPPSVLANGIKIIMDTGPSIRSHSVVLTGLSETGFRCDRESANIRIYRSRRCRAMNGSVHFTRFGQTASDWRTAYYTKPAESGHLGRLVRQKCS